MEQNRNNNQEITVEQLLTITKDEVLGEISVPAKYKHQIMDPIEQAMNNIQICLNAFQRLAQQEQQKKKEENDIQIEEVGSVDSLDELPKDTELVEIGGE